MGNWLGNGYVKDSFNEMKRSRVMDESANFGCIGNHRELTTHHVRVLGFRVYCRCGKRGRKQYTKGFTAVQERGVTSS